MRGLPRHCGGAQRTQSCRRNAAYIVAQLKAFRDGKRQYEQISIIAADLGDGDIADLARWYSLIKVVATPPDLD